MIKEDRKKLRKLLKKWTRAEIIARHGPFDNLEFVGYYDIKLQMESEIRKLLYGSSDLITLGIQWGILEERGKKKRKPKKETLV